MPSHHYKNSFWRTVEGFCCMTIFRYVHAAEVAEFTRKGWTCSALSHHHGASGYWLASRKA